MDSELGLGNEVQGRIFHASCSGDNASEIEIAALALAQEFFGDGVPLEVVQDYQVYGLTPGATGRVRQEVQGWHQGARAACLTVPVIRPASCRVCKVDST